MIRRHDPFSLALDSLRRRAEDGVFAPGGPIVILDEARRLRLSTTPVREALAWLCGFGLVERGPTGGYLAPRLDPASVRDRFALRLHLVSTGLEIARAPASDPSQTPPAGDAGGLDVSMRHAVRRTGNRALLDAFDRNASQLARLAAAERRVFPDHDAETRALADRFQGPHDALRDALRAHHERRMEAAPLLVMAVENGRHRPEDEP